MQTALQQNAECHGDIPRWARKTMFSHLCVTGHNGDSKPIDFGRLIEQMLFYGSVSVAIGRGELSDLLRAAGPDCLNELMETHGLRVLYMDRVVAIHSTTIGSVRVHSPVHVGTSNLEMERSVIELNRELAGRSEKTRQASRKMLALLRQSNYSEEALNGARCDLSDAAFVDDTTRRLLQVWGVDERVAQHWTFRPVPHCDGYAVETNIDFSQVARARGYTSFDPAHILSEFATARAQLALAASENAELGTYDASSLVIDALLRKLSVERVGTSPGIATFQSMIFDEGHAIANAVNSRAASVRDALRLLKEAGRFRGWLAKLPPDANLLHEYYSKVTETSWVSRLPAKVFRWLLFTGISLPFTDPTSAAFLGLTAANAADAFLLEKFAGGWKPNHFVDGKLKAFVRKTA